MVTRFARPAALVSTVWLSVMAAAQLAALRAAGMNGTPPPHAAQFRALIGTLTDNWTWLVATGIGLVLVVLVLLAGMMVFGDIRAPEKLFRVAGGIVVILVLIPAVLA
jgi:chromate transport protein ChrA